MKLARDKGYERLVKLEKGKNSDRIHQIRVRHNESLKIPISFMSWINILRGKFTLLMGKAFTKFFSKVRVALTNALFYVKTAVSVCTCCVQCPDAIIRATICKHTHLVVRFLSSTSNPILYKPPNIEKLDVLQHIQNADNTDNIEKAYNLSLCHYQDRSTLKEN